MKAEVWERIRTAPTITSIVLTDDAERPIEVTGQQMLELLQDGVVEILSAAYRLRLVEGKEQLFLGNFGPPNCAEPPGGV